MANNLKISDLKYGMCFINMDTDNTAIIVDTIDVGNGHVQVFCHASIKKEHLHENGKSKGINCDRWLSLKDFNEKMTLQTK